MVFKVKGNSFKVVKKYRKNNNDFSLKEKNGVALENGILSLLLFECFKGPFLPK